MGMYTCYTLKAFNFDDKEKAEFFEFKLKKHTGGLYDAFDSHIISNKDGTYSIEFETIESKWYEHVKELEEISIAFSDIIIEVEGSGEEQGDQWKLRVRNGESEKIAATITFEEFKNII